MKPIRILQVIGSLNNGGSQAMIMNIYENIDRSKVQFDFVIDRPNDLAYGERIEELGGKIFVIPQFTAKNTFAFYKAWNEFFSNHSEYKIVHGHVRSTAAIYLKIAKMYGLTTISHSHSTSSGNGLTALVKNILQYPIRNTADYFFSCSKSAGEWLFGKRVCTQKNFFLLKNAIDAERFTFNKQTRVEKRKEYNVDDKFVIGHVGRFNTPKNHEFLINTFKLIYEKNSRAILMLVGDGELREKVQQRVDELGITNQVIFTGARSDIADLLQAMDVFLFPSLYEGLGIAVIEAQASGLPCIVSNMVPSEAIVTEHVNKMTLSEGVDKWADKALGYMGYRRGNSYEQIKEAGYHIKDTAKWIEDFYLYNYG